MRRLRWVLGLLTAGVFLCSVRAADAQGYGGYSASGAASRYGLSIPSTPRLSPWLNLYRRDSGPLDNYHTFVRPEQQLYRTLRQQQASLQQQRASLGALGQDVSRLERPGSIRPTGTGGVFMNYSHYYPSGSYSAGRR